MLKDQLIKLILITVVFVLGLTYFLSGNNFKPYYSKGETKIFLYGETHGREELLQKELKPWGEKYGEGFRHLFTEHPYYTAEFLNLWMKEENDEKLNLVFDNL